jgi:phage-related protein
MARGASLRGADGNITVGTQVDVGGINTGLAKIEKQFNRLGRVAASALSFSGLVKLGKVATESASDLQEVQNIVDVTFGDMEKKVEDFASTSIEKFGMSELSAKQTAGSFMAMGNAMGFARKDAANMSLQLTALTGDFASFYNISQDYARVALSAVYTGETETLKRYGIILTEANLQQYALSQGITTSVKAMSAQEKTLLRYNYILQATKDMQGDFSRTQDNWANQVRVLKENWTRFMIVLGSGLIAVLQPMIKVLNAIIERLIAFSKTIGSILGKIFGIKPAVTQQTNAFDGMAESAGAASDAQDDLAKSTKNVGKAAKNALSPLDELNIITQDSASGGAGGAGGGAGVADFPIDDYVNDVGMVDKLKDKLKTDIDDLYGLGQYLSFTLYDMLKNIDWDKIYAGAMNFGTGLAEFLNGLFQPVTFYQVGRTIANSLNTAIYASLAFTDEFDFANFGNSLAGGVNGFFENFDFGSLAESIDGWVQGIYTAIVNFVQGVEWDKVWDGAKEFLTHLDLKTVSIIIDVLTIASVGKLVLGVVPALIAKQLATAIATEWAAGGGLLGLAESFSLFAGGAATSLVESVGAVFGPVMAFFTTVAGIASIIGGAVLAVVNFFAMLKDGFSWLNEAFMIIGIALAAIGAIILGAPALIAGVVAGIVALVATAVVVIKDHWDAIAKFFKAVWEGFIDIVQAVFDWIVDKVKRDIDVLITFFKLLGEGAKATWEAIKLACKIVWNAIVDIVKTAIDILVGAVRTWADIFKTVWNGVKAFFTALWDGIVSVVKTCINWIVNAVDVSVKTIKSVCKTIATFIKSWVIDPIVGFVEGLWRSIKKVINAILGGIQNAINAIVSGINTLIKGVNKVKLKTPDWIPGIGGKEVGFSIGTLSNVSLPRLANGAVIPPNKEFMAVLGDQSHGTNIEAPLSTIQDAVAVVLAPYLERLININEQILDKDTTVNIGDRQIAQAAIRGQRELGTNIRVQ